jgi:Carboxypeptidase regulatory-like domain
MSKRTTIRESAPPLSRIPGLRIVCSPLSLTGLAVLVLCITLLGGSGVAQTTTGSIFGTVTDQTGSVIPNAAITATEITTGIARTTQSNASGNYLFPSVPAGDYNITAQAKGFGTQTQNGLHVDVNQSANAKFKLTIGGVSQSVTVTSGTSLVDTRESQLGQTVDQKRIEDLPLNGRDVSSLVQLVPGITSYSG